MSKEADEYILQLELECYVWVNGDKKNAELVIKKGVLLHMGVVPSGHISLLFGPETEL